MENNKCPYTKKPCKTVGCSEGVCSILEVLKHDDGHLQDIEGEFIPCSRCDGHSACADFGCAYALGLGRYVKKEPTDNDWL
jgi:hypothetical protein